MRRNWKCTGIGSASCAKMFELYSWNFVLSPISSFYRVCFLCWDTSKAADDKGAYQDKTFSNTRQHSRVGSVGSFDAEYPTKIIMSVKFIIQMPYVFRVSAPNFRWITWIRANRSYSKFRLRTSSSGSTSANISPFAVIAMRYAQRCHVCQIIIVDIKAILLFLLWQSVTKCMLHELHRSTCVLVMEIYNSSKPITDISARKLHFSENFENATLHTRKNALNIASYCSLRSQEKSRSDPTPLATKWGGCEYFRVATASPVNGGCARNTAYTYPNAASHLLDMTE